MRSLRNPRKRGCKQEPSPRRSDLCILSDVDDNSLPPTNFALTAAIFEGALVFVAVGLGWLLNQPPLETFHWKPVGLVLGPLLALPPLAIVLVGVRGPFWPFSAIRRVVDEMLVPLFRQFTIGEMAIISALGRSGRGDALPRCFSGVHRPLDRRQWPRRPLARRRGVRLARAGGRGRPFRIGAQCESWHMPFLRG